MIFISKPTLSYIMTVIIIKIMVFKLYVYVVYVVNFEFSKVIHNIYSVCDAITTN